MNLGEKVTLRTAIVDGVVTGVNADGYCHVTLASGEYDITVQMSPDTFAKFFGGER